MRRRCGRIGASLLLCAWLCGCHGTWFPYYNRPSFGPPPYGQPLQPAPIYSPTPAPIGAVPGPQPPSGPVATDPNAINPSDLTLQPAMRTSAVYPAPRPVWRMPTTFAPSTSSFGPRYAGLARTFDGRSVPISYASNATEPPAAADSVKAFAPTPEKDLKFRGGRTIASLHFINIYIGPWNESDRKNIDGALKASMSDPHLNHVVMQYFENQPISAAWRGSFLLNGYRPQRVTQANVREVVKILHGQGYFRDLPLENTAINFFLASGIILDDPQSSASTPGIPTGEAANSLAGLGGYHGSVHIGSDTLYYTVGAYAERLPTGQTNGVPVFGVPWKDIAASFYHQLQELRTDPDVDDAIATGKVQHVGWSSDDGEEVGDIAVTLDSQDARLGDVFVEVPLADGSGKVPVQLVYSNAIHGPEGPIAQPHGGQPLPEPSQPSQPSNPGTGDPDLDYLRQHWDHLPEALKLKILELIKQADADERSPF